MGTERWPPGSPVRVLLIDDDRDDYLLTKDLFAAIPGGRFRLDHAPNYETGLAAIRKGDYDVYLLDYRLGSRSGLELHREYQQQAPRAPFIVFNAQGEFAIDQDGMRAAGAVYLEQ